MSKLSILKQKTKRDVDMTQGSIFRHLITFAFPLLIGNIFQQLYNTVDTWVVGNYVSNEAFSAVGTVGPVINMLIGGVVKVIVNYVLVAIPSLNIIGAAIGEWLGAKSGLGYFSRRMMTQLDGAGVFAPIVLLSAVAMAAVALVALLEKKVVRWRGEF